MKNLPNTNDIICKEIFNKTINTIMSLSKKMKIDNLSKDFLKEIVIPLAVFFNEQKKDRPFLIGLTGGQGSGKTTLSEFVQLVLQVGFGKETIGFSIDDIYKTREEREEMAKLIHPLCKVRGVPGTHNVKLGLDTLDSLCKADASSLTLIPGATSVKVILLFIILKTPLSVLKIIICPFLIPCLELNVI